MSFLDKARPIQQVKSASALSFASKVRPKEPEMFTYDQPEDRQTKIARLQEEARQAEREAKKARSVGGFLKNAANAPVAENLPFIGGALAVGKTLNKAIDNPFDRESNNIMSLSDTNLRLKKRIDENEKLNKDSTKLKQIYNENVSEIKKSMAMIKSAQAELPTNQQAVGQVAHVGLDVLTAGTYKKGFKTGALGKAKPTLVKEGQDILRESKGIFTKQGLKNVVTEGAKVAPVGYAYDVALGLEGNRGENRTGVRSLIPGAGTALSFAFPALTESAKSVSNILTKEGRDASRLASMDKTIAKREQEIKNIETNYAQTRKANKFSKDEGTASRKRVASTDVLVGAIDQDGIIRTQQKGGAIDQYKALTIDNAENVVRNNLERLGEKVQVQKVRQQLLKSIHESGLEGNDLVNALKNVDKEIEGYALKADPEGNIPLTLVHDAKISTTKNINYQTPPEVQRYRKSVASGLKKVVEDNSSFNTEEVNKELSKYLEDIKLLERLDGKRVKGGKLGKYFSQISGNIIGGVAGGAIGGPAGSAIGTVVGGELGSRIKGNFMSKTLGGNAGKTIPKSKILNQAIETGNSPRLMLPARNTPVNVRLESGKTINLPAKSQSTLDKNYSNNLGNRNTKYNSTSTPTTMGISPTLPQANNKSNMQGGFISTGYKEKGNLTTKILKDLEGKTTVSKQYILDATNRGELKQVERDITRQVLDTMPDGQVNVADFAKKVKTELLPLKVVKNKDLYTGNNYGAKYENITLPNELRGNVKNYRENVYESPVKTSAGNTHFSEQGKDNYFGHTRIEDMADNNTRRVIEVQSDLYQKGKLENEFSPTLEKYQNPNVVAKNKGDYKKLQQYNDPTAHFRMVREEIKKAAQDGKTKLQFPTGETAMKIEGLGETPNWRRIYDMDGRRISDKLEISDLKTGETVNQAGQDRIITDVLGDGKFKAMPKEHFDSFQEAKGVDLSGEDLISYAEQHGTQNFWGSNETFDISGKVDTNNPIYKFYEKDVQKYLNKYGGKKITDENGVEWIEVPIKKEYAKQPVEAFGKIKGGLLFPVAGASAVGVLGAGYLKSKQKK